MPPEHQKLPRSTSSMRIRRTVGKLKMMPITDRIQLLVKANLMSQDEADRAKGKLAETGVADR
jgi:hypothetical protein